MRILMLASEAVPLAKTGGLADVAGTLPVELARLGHEVQLALPRYASIDPQVSSLRQAATVAVPFRGDSVEVGIETGALGNKAGSLVCIRYDPFFSRTGLYGEEGRDYPDNLERFVLFCRAVLEACRQPKRPPDVLHAHDWQTALAVAYLKTLYRDDPAWEKTRVLFTIHNMGYQGRFPVTDYPATGLPWSEYTPERLEFYGQVNLLKGGLVYADLLNTVSPTYAREIQTVEFGHGLEGVLQTLSGKKACKTALQREMKLPARNVPLLGLVSRLAFQKGIDLIVEILPKLLELDVQMVALGSGEPAYHQRLTDLSTRYPGKLAVRLAFDEGLAHRIEAGADLSLMPSRYEPCGLNQLYSLRYGTVPVVRKTGGLADTVVPYLSAGGKGNKATGFAFETPQPEVLLSTILLALRVYRDKEEWQALMRRGMKQDFSWQRSAKQYVELYERARAV
ncbi:MAG: glycogen synthase [Nitrospirae bacterium]|nr:MAG: glycogen synthase [Nitrospirota bacterium]